VYVGDYHHAPTWAYTVGLDETLNQPELIVFDAPQHAAGALFSGACDALKAGPLVLEDWLVWPEGEERPGVWRKVHPGRIDDEEGWLTMAVWRRAERIGRRGGLEAFQYVLSDNNGTLPWEAGYNEELRPLQPALWLPADTPMPALAVEPAL
jgi:hypothetical protein